MKDTASNYRIHRIVSIFILIIMTVCLLVLTAGCKAKTKPEEIQERGVLRVGTAGDYQPMSYLDPETGSYVGFDAELAEDLADAMGV